ncbi:ribonuclease H-like protein [Teratosphaeria destructans]|uniref:ribonuclease H n=1 Tax=Teratosphaeria destructans TaxID=418781 RepID=A0A9W7W282_9PEZI|nr:ribonuclease H-like protein [Teratosphaeria destructans]
MASRQHTEFHCPSGRHHQRERSKRLIAAGDCHGNKLIESTWKNEWWTLLGCHEGGIMHAPVDPVVIAVDGACRDNGRSNPKAGLGIFFHRDNIQWNRAKVPPASINTNNRAELAAAIEALKMAKRLRKLNPQRDRHSERQRIGPMRRLRRVVIKAASEDLVRGMTDCVYIWKANGWNKSAGDPVSNPVLFRELDQLTTELNDMGVEVQFLHVDRSLNKPADRLANAASDGVSAVDALARYLRSGDSEDDSGASGE